MRLAQVGDGMTEDEIREKIFDIVAKEARLEQGPLTLETKLEDLKIESLDMVHTVRHRGCVRRLRSAGHQQKFRLVTMRDVVDGAKRLIAEKRAA